MNKVKLTREQAEMIENMVGEYGSKERVMNGHAYAFNHGGWKRENARILEDITPSTMAQALYIGYEIKQEFVVGDWVVTEDGMAAEIIDVCMFHNDSVALYGVDGRHTIDTLRHATLGEIKEEKERRWWAKHGRDVWELREFDELRDKRNDNRYTVSESVENINAKLYDTYINPTYFNQEDIKENFLVVCFAEDRLDLNE